MPIFRIERELPTGWKMRLDYCPYDTEYDPNGTITAVDGVALIELGEHLAEFDSLPYGMANPQSLKLKLAWSLLPSGMIDYLKDGCEPEDTLIGPPPPGGWQLKQNIFVLWTDRGTTRNTGTTTWTCEFAGCEDNTEGVDYVPDVEDVYVYDVELVDICYHALKNTTGYQAFQAMQYPTGTTQDTFGMYEKAWLTYNPSVPGTNQYQKVQSFIAKAYSAAEVMRRTLYAFAQTFTVAYSRSDDYATGLNASGTLNAALDGFSRTEVIELITRACEWHKYTFARPRLENTSVLTKDEVYLIGELNMVSTSPEGGMFGYADEYGWGRKDTTLYDVLRDLCETLAVKVTYRFEYTTGTYNGLVTKFTVRRIGTPIGYSDTGANVYDTRLGTNNFLESDKPKIGKRQDNIAKAEVRFGTQHSEDIKELVRVQQGARGSRSMNIEPIIHNAPVYLPEWDKYDGRYGGLVQTNLVGFKNGNSFHKTHENTRVRFLPGSGDGWVDASSTALQEPVSFYDGENDGNYRVQLNAVQASAGLPNALVKLHLHLWANTDNAVVETAWALDHTTLAMTDKLGAVHDLSYAEDGGTGGASIFTTAFSRLAWSRAILTSSAIDYKAGTVKVKYFLLAQSENKS